MTTLEITGIYGVLADDKVEDGGLRRREHVERMDVG